MEVTSAQVNAVDGRRPSVEHIFGGEQAYSRNDGFQRVAEKVIWYGSCHCWVLDDRQNKLEEAAEATNNSNWTGDGHSDTLNLYNTSP